jgi:hypothetical protein
VLARARWSVLLLAILVAVLPASARAVPAAPELFVSEYDSSNPQAPPSWVPLAGARMTGAYRYKLGIRLQANSDTLHRAYVLIRATSSPQRPQNNAQPIVPGAGTCAQVRGNAGDIAEWGTASYFGDGLYGLTAALADYAPGPCPVNGGPATTGSFTVDARPSLAIVDARANDLRRAGPFRGVRVVLTRDANIPEVTCALRPVLQADGSLKGSVVTHGDDLSLPDRTLGFAEGDAFPESGRWACVARAIGGPDDLHTNWSAPVAATVHGDLRVRLPEVMLDRTYPTYRAKLHVDRGAAGGTVTFALKSCGRYSKSPSGRRLSTKRLTLRFRVDARGDITVRFKRKVPFAQFGRYFVGPARFSGNALIAKSTTKTLFAFSEYVDSFAGPLLGIYEQPKRC